MLGTQKYSDAQGFENKTITSSLKKVEHSDLENKSCTMSIKVCSAERRRSSEDKQKKKNSNWVHTVETF